MYPNQTVKSESTVLVSIVDLLLAHFLSQAQLLFICLLSGRQNHTYRSQFTQLLPLIRQRLLVRPFQEVLQSLLVPLL